nr:NADH dehydrogenase subunit 5 [Ovalona pulchella]
MTNFVYRKIFVLLFSLSIFLSILGIYIDWTMKSFFIEWTLGGGPISFSVTFFIDKMALLFLATVFFISANVVMYSQSYMEEDVYLERFILLVFGFVISMFLLIISPNILSILLGWDGLGLVSYCLVIYYSSKKSNSAGMLTVLSNRVGDVCLLISIAWFTMVGDYVYLFWVDSFSFLWQNKTLSLLIMLAAITKSAQIPFSAWLPAAMAAPTPVSALVHSSTLVTAGVYLLIRFSLFIHNDILNVLFILSILTMFMAGLVAAFECDLKKVIALSTLSQLGVMMFSISLGLHDIAFFHLITHALFKAMLFLCAGILIHGVVGSQDIRDFGSMISMYPMVGVCLNLANLSLCGLPFMSGFYSKDLIVELAVQGNWSTFMMLILYMSLGLTVFYSFRLTYYSFVSESRGLCMKFLADNEYILVGPVINLSICSLLTGPFLSNFLLVNPSLVLLPFSIKILTLLIILAVSISFIWLSLDLSMNFNLASNTASFNGLMWGLPILSGQSPSLLALKLGNFLTHNMDMGWLEWMSVKMMLNNNSSGIWMNHWHYGIFKNHFLIMLFWIILFIMWNM